MAKNVMLYALSTCSHCRNTKRFLDDNTVDYDVVDVDLAEGNEQAALVEEVKKYNPRLTFPTLVVDDEVIVGFREDDIRKALGL